MLVLAAFFLTWVILKPPPPVTMAEMEATRKAREEFGTRAGQGAAGAHTVLRVPKFPRRL